MKQKGEPFVNWRMVKAELISLTCIKVTCRGDCQEQVIHWCLQTNTSTRSLDEIKREEETYYLELKDPFPFGEQCVLRADQQQLFVEVTDVVRTKEFDLMFSYTHSDLGVTITTETVKLAVWAPTATRVSILLYSSWHTCEYEKKNCQRSSDGVWRITLPPGCIGKYYVYEVEVNQQIALAVDPYAKFLSINGERAQINIITAKGNADELLSRKSVIYEVHIRDFSIDAQSGITKKGKYMGITEKGTTTLGGKKSGIDYLQELGISFVELLPVQDFGSVDESNWKSTYNWGYDTTHFFVPEGSYSSDPYDPKTRITELKSVIEAFHKKEIAVILDVVFNHVYVREDSALEKLVPGYYFRYDHLGQISDGTGVGNDFASERLMARKMVVDAVEYWLTYFHVDGFRFDLMGILDVETMKEIADKASASKRNVFLLGEGWVLPTAYATEQLATIEQAKEITGVSFFQDEFRDAVKGSTFNESDGGFVSGDLEPTEALLNGLKGSPQFFNKPEQAINYVESHDNYTLWDKLRFVHEDEDDELVKKRHRLATTMVILAQGIPFLHAGQEWYRTKFGVENSYKSPDWINKLNWSNRERHEQYVDYVKGLLKLKRGISLFQIQSYEEVESAFTLLVSKKGCLSYQLEDDKRVMIITFNATARKQKIILPFKGKWQVVVDDLHASLIPLYTLGVDCVIARPISTIVCMYDKSKA